MKVNIEGVWYDAEKVAIQLYLTDADKVNINNMHPSANNYVGFPSEMGWEKAQEVLGIKVAGNLEEVPERQPIIAKDENTETNN